MKNVLSNFLFYGMYFGQLLYISKLFIELHNYVKNILSVFEVLLWGYLFIYFIAAISLFLLSEKPEMIKEIKINFAKKMLKKDDFWQIVNNIITFLISFSVLIAASAFMDRSMILVQGLIFALQISLLGLVKKYKEIYIKKAKEKFPNDFIEPVKKVKKKTRLDILKESY